MGPNGNRMGRIDMSSPNRKSPTHSEIKPKPMRISPLNGPRIFLEFKKKIKAANSHDMVEDVGSIKKLLDEQNSLLET